MYQMQWNGQQKAPAFLDFFFIGDMLKNAALFFRMMYGTVFRYIRFEGTEVRSIMDHRDACNQGRESFSNGVINAVAKMSMSGI